MELKEIRVRFNDIMPGAAFRFDVTNAGHFPGQYIKKAGRIFTPVNNRVAAYQATGSELIWIAGNC